MTTAQIEEERKLGTKGLFFNHDTGHYVELRGDSKATEVPKFPAWNSEGFRKMVEILRDIAKETNYAGLPADSFWRPQNGKLLDADTFLNMTKPNLTPDPKIIADAAFVIDQQVQNYTQQYQVREAARNMLRGQLDLLVKRCFVAALKQYEGKCLICGASKPEKWATTALHDNDLSIFEEQSKKYIGVASTVAQAVSIVQKHNEVIGQ